VAPRLRHVVIPRRMEDGLDVLTAFPNVGFVGVLTTIEVIPCKEANPDVTCIGGGHVGGRGGNGKPSQGSNNNGDRLHCAS